MNDLNPRSAGSTDVALNIARKILSLNGLASVRKEMQHHGNLRTFCGFVAREIDKELVKEFLDHGHDFTFTPGEQGRMDGIDSKLRNPTSIKGINVIFPLPVFILGETI